ncbi:MAG: PEP-CTERM sorting domain-containing protein [Nostoc sp.]|uniref:PEP-CTERM sorting domain-containing protein n=1 Tax=Nostoc sp. TaxID=1180 RepID=UPI002FF45953
MGKNTKTKLILSATPLRRLSQVTATAALGFAMLAAIDTDHAQAVNLKTFNISGNFASASEDGSVGLPVNLANASFNGSYTVDVDQLPASSSFVDLKNWTVNLVKDNTILRTLSNNLAGNTAYIQENILAFSDAGLLTKQNNKLYSFELNFDKSFTGTDSTNDGNFLDNSDLGNVKNSGITAVTFAQSEPVPEPQSIAGTVVIVTIGLSLKRKQKT